LLTTILKLIAEEKVETVQKLQELSNRIEHLQSLADWVTRETTHSDNAVSQTATLITVLAEDIRERVYEVVRECEEYTALHVQ
jgi:hypothetical protein